MGKWTEKISDPYRTQVSKVPKAPPPPPLDTLDTCLPKESEKNAPHRLWLIRHPDGELISHSFTPPATFEEVRGWYPDCEIRVETAEEEREYRELSPGKNELVTKAD